LAGRFEVQWSESALGDLDEILEYVAAQDGYGAAERVYSKLIRRIDSLELHPLRCRIVPELKEAGHLNFRDLIIWPYRVFFRSEASKVILVAVLDGRRDLEAILIRRALSK
jgi:toxin ParE1/3/4